MDRRLGMLGAVMVAIAACSDDGDGGVKCGDGTVLRGGECVVSLAGAGHPGGSSSGEAGAIDRGGTTSTSGSSALGGNDAQGGNAGSSGSEALAGGDGGVPGTGGSPEAGRAGEGGSADGDTTLIKSPLDCGSRDVTGATVITEPVTQDSIWSGVIHLPYGVSVHAEPTIIIEPGTRIIVGSGATVEFGYQNSQATVVALGTAEEPIRFCGEASTAGYYAGVVFRAGLKGESVLRNVLIADGGQTDAGLTLEMPLVVQGVQVRNSGAYGVHAAGFGTNSSTLIVSGAAMASVLAKTPAALAVPPDSVLTGNQVDAIELGFTSFDADATFVERGVPYHVINEMTPPGGALAPLIVMEPGVELRIRAGLSLDFGRATLQALGTEDAPIWVHGLKCRDFYQSSCASLDATGRGGRMVISGDDLELTHIELRGLGSGAFSITTDTAIRADHVTVTAAHGFGIEIIGEGTFTDDSATIAVESTGYAFLLECPQVMTLPADTVAKTSGIRVSSCSTDATSTWPVVGQPYTVEDVRIESGGNLTLPAGTRLNFQTNTGLTVESGGTLIAQGTAGARVELVGGWAGIVAEAGSTVSLDHTLILGGGNTLPHRANIAALGPISLTNSFVTNSAGWGLKKAASDTTDYLTGNTFMNNASGNITNLP